MPVRGGAGFARVPAGNARRRARSDGEGWRGGERVEKKREREEANVCTIHGRALRVFSVPNETVVILWSASALERYTVGTERLGRISPSVSRSGSVIFPSPQRAES